MADPLVADVPAPRTSWLFAHGFEMLDVVAVFVALLLCVAFGDFFLIPNWTPRMMVVLAAAPLGLSILAIQIVRRDSIALASAALIAVAVVAGLASGHARSTLLGTFGTEESVLILASSLGLLAIGRETTVQGRRATGWAVVGGAAISSLVGLLQYLVKADGGMFAMISDRASGLTPNPVYFGAVSAGAFGIVVARRTTNPRTIVVDTASAALFGLAISISGTRVALGAAVLVGFAAAVTIRTLRPLVMCAGLLVGLFTGSLLTGVFGAGSSATSRVTGGSTGDRGALWSNSLAAFSERPIFGWGSGEFRRAVQPHISVDTSRRFGAGLARSMFDAHNAFLAVAVSLGVLGLAAVLVLLVLIARRARGALIFGAGALALSWLLQPMGLATFPLALLLVGVTVPSVRAPSVAAVGVDRVTGDERGLARRRGLLWLLVPGVVAALYLGTIEVSVNAAIERSDPERAAQLVELLPPDPVLAEFVAQSWQRHGLDSGDDTMDHVIEWSERARDLQDEMSRWWVRLAVRQYVAGDRQAALSSVRQARALEPNAWSAINVELALLEVLELDEEYDALLPLACDLAVPACPTND